jgi:hypothetical protein
MGGLLMNTTIQQPSAALLVALLLGLTACNPGEISVDEEVDTPPDMPADLPDTPTPPPADLPPACEEPLVECDGECVDLMADNENCGQCGFVCPRLWEDKEPGEIGATLGCLDGKCAPDWMGCIDPDDARSCDEVCASKGGGWECSEAGCGVLTMLWVSLAPAFPEPSCSDLDGIKSAQDIGCDLPANESFAMEPTLSLGDRAFCCCDHPDY